MLDGFVLRHRIQPEDFEGGVRDDVTAFSDAIVAFLIGTIGWKHTGRPARDLLDSQCRA